MARTTEAAVRTRLAGNYDSKTALATFLVTAGLLTNQVATADTASLLSAEVLAELELLLSCHCYQAFVDQGYTSKSTGGASGSFRGQYGMNLDLTPYGQMAKLLDATGYLNRINKADRPKASMTWLGKPKSQQIALEDRD